MCEHHNAHEDEECEQRGRVERSGGPTSFQPFLGEERRIRIAPVTCCRAWMLVAAHPASLAVLWLGGSAERAPCWDRGVNSGLLHARVLILVSLLTSHAL